jgi:hypothetical protein
MFSPSKKLKIMALEISHVPVLTGQVAKDFLKKVENFTVKETAAEVQEGLRQFREYMATQKHIQHHVGPTQ